MTLGRSLTKNRNCRKNSLYSRPDENGKKLANNPDDIITIENYDYFRN